MRSSSRLRDLPLSAILWVMGLLVPAPACIASDIDPLELARPAIRVYTDRDGLPENSIFDIEFDAPGYPWVATENGPAYYDGRRWWPLELPPQLRSRFVRALLPAADGSLWLGMDEGGLLHRQDEQWTVYDRASGFVADSVVDLLEQPRPGAAPLLWVATAAGLVRFENDQWQVFDAAAGLHEATLTRLALSSETNTLWVGTRKGVARFIDGRFDPSVVEAPGAALSSVGGLVESASGKLWAAFASGGLRVFESGQWRAVEGPNPRMFALHLSDSSADGNAWIGTFGSGLLQYRSGRWTAFDSEWGLPTDVVRSLRETVSPEGRRTLWVGTQGGGLLRMNDFGWRTLDRRNGLPDNQVRRILETHDADGGISLWFATSKGLARLQQGRWLYYGKQTLGSDEALEMILQRRADGSEALWVALGTHVARFANEQWRVWGPEDGLSGNVNYLADMAEDDQGQVFVGSWGGDLLQFDGEKVARVDDGSGRFGQTQNLQSTPTPDGSRIMWVSTAKGLIRREGGRWIDPAVSPPPPIASPNSLLLTWDAAGSRRLWIGGRGSGGPFSLELDDPQAIWRDVREEVRGELPESVIDFAQGSDGHIYLYSTRGVVQLSPRANPDNRQYDALTFTTNDGLPSDRVNYNGSYIDHAGRVWAGTLGGAAYFDPAGYVADRTSKPLYIDRADIGGSGLALMPGQQLPHDQNNLRFHLALLSTFREAESQFRTELQGFDRGPGTWTSEAHREVTNLAPGAYLLRAWGRDWAGNVSGPEQLAFSIRPPWWNWWGAWLLYALMMATMGWGAVRWRTLRLRARAQQLHLLVAARTADLQHSNQDLERSKRELESSHARLLGTQQQLVQQEKMAALGTLTAGVAHEINNPTNFADGAVQQVDAQLRQLHSFLRELAGADAPQRVLDAIAARFEGLSEMTATAREGHERIKRIVADLRQFTRLDEAERKSVPIADPIRSTVNLVRTRFDRVRFELELDYNPAIECQPAKLGQVFMNLVVNACQAIDECADGRQGVVHIATRPCDDAVEISVADNGAGMADSSLQRVFEPFYTTKEVGSGTGLGLSIVFGIVEEHGGSIEVESHVGVGTRFMLRLPMTPVSLADSLAGPAPRSPDRPSA